MSNQNELAAVLERLASGTAQEREAAALLEEALARRTADSSRSLKGAIATQAAADRRRRVWESAARELLAARARPFGSYNQLADAVARRPGVIGSADRIRKHLAAIAALEEVGQGVGPAQGDPE